MLEKGQNWQLFGYDVRHLGRYWTAAWRDLLWAHDSPLRARLDEVVQLRSATDTRCYQASAICTSAAEAECKAILLPDDLVLTRQLRVPLQAESELDSLLALEVKSSSPFSVADTRWGWGVISRDTASIRIALGIVSASAAMTFLGREHDSHDSLAQEVWLESDGAMIVVQGFGEGLRERRYRKRLLQCASLIAAIAVLTLTMAGVAALFKGAELQRLEQISATTMREAAEASRFKTLLAVANETIAAANEVVARYPNPHAEIARLTRVLSDDASISSFAMAGEEIRLRGRAGDAALVMQQLTDEPGYLQVLAPQAISRVAGGQEQFYLNIRLGQKVSQ